MMYLRIRIKRYQIISPLTTEQITTRLKENTAADLSGKYTGIISDHSFAINRVTERGHKKRRSINFVKGEINTTDTGTIIQITSFAEISYEHILLGIGTYAIFFLTKGYPAISFIHNMVAFSCVIMPLYIVFHLFDLREELSTSKRLLLKLFEGKKV